MRDRYDIGVEDIDVAGAELSDEQLLAVRGGLYSTQALSTCTVGGHEDGDGPVEWWF